MILKKYDMCYIGKFNISDTIIKLYIISYIILYYSGENGPLCLIPGRGETHFHH